MGYKIAYMATIYLRGKTWTAQWYRNGERIAKSTGLTGKREAQKKAAQMESDDLKAIAEGDEHQTRYARILNQVATEAKEGRLTAKKAEEFIHRIRCITDPSHGTITVAGQIAEWVTNQKKRTSTSTGKGYGEMETAVTNAAPEIATKPIHDLTHKDCEALIHALKEGRTAATANQHFRAFRRAIQAAVTAKHIGDNPAVGIAPLPEDDSTERAPFTAKEVIAMLEHPETSDEWRGMILFGGNTGLREMDIVKLDADLIEDGTLVMRPKKTKRKGKANIVRIPLSKPLLKWLEGRTGPLFLELSKKSAPTLWYHFKRIMERSKVKDKVMVAGKEAKRSFHSLRHSFTTWLAEADIHPDVRRKLTGHSTADAHAIYTHHDESLKKAIEALPQLSNT